MSNTVDLSRASFVWAVLIMSIRMQTTVNLSLNTYIQCFPCFVWAHSVSATLLRFYMVLFYTRCMFTNIRIILFSSLVAVSMKVCYCAKAATLYECP